jgi:hypothetical protein
LICVLPWKSSKENFLNISISITLVLFLSSFTSSSSLFFAKGGELL